MRPAQESDRANLLELTQAALAEAGRGRGGSKYISDLAGRLGVTSPELASSIVSAVVTTGTIDDDAFAVVTEGLALIYVATAKRRSGIGTALFRHIASETTELWAKPGDRAAKSFAESLGLKARLLIMSAESHQSDGR